MSREQLLDLANELDRLLAAGAKSAAGSDALRRRGKAIEELAAKVPALVPLKDAINKVITAPAKDAPLALLTLLSMARQMRANLGDSTSPGELASVIPRSGCQTTVAARRAHELFDTFTGGGSGKHSTLAEALKNKEVNDLRLQRTFLDALEDGDSSFAEAASQEALPQLGVAVLPDLLAAIDIKEGETADARRLVSICKIDKEKGAELARQALKEGSVKVLVQALESLPDVVTPTEAEKAGLELAQDKRAGVRAAAIQALRTSKKDAALDLILEKTSDKSSEVCNVAFTVLGTLKHPQTTERLMAAVQEQLDTLTVVPKQSEKKKPAAKGARAPAKGKAAPKTPKLSAEEIGALQTKRHEELSRCQSLLNSMANRKDLQRAEVAEFIAKLIDHKEYQISTPARAILISVGPAVPEVVPTLKKLIEGSTGWQFQQVVEMMKGVTPEQRTDLMPHLFKGIGTGYMPWGVAQALLGMLREHAATDPKPVQEFLEKNLKGKEQWLWNLCVSHLLEQPTEVSREYVLLAIEGYLKFASSSYMPGNGELVNWLKRDEPDLKTSLPKIVKVLEETKKVDVRQMLLLMLKEFGPRAAAAKPTVEKFLKDRNKDIKELAGTTLEAITPK